MFGIWYPTRTPNRNPRKIKIPCASIDFKQIVIADAIVSESTKFRYIIKFLITNAKVYNLLDVDFFNTNCFALHFGVHQKCIDITMGKFGFPLKLFFGNLTLKNYPVLFKSKYFYILTEILKSTFKYRSKIKS